MKNRIKLDLGPKSYDIIIARNSEEHLNNFLNNAPKKYSKIFIISDESVANLYLDRVKNSIDSRYKTESIIVGNGESSKNFDAFRAVCEAILSKGADRNSLIIALGGGVVGDLAGFVASVILRGIDFVQMPTTLLSAVDSSVGGKTAINSKSGKNLIGSFYQPKLVLCDLNFLTSLPERELRAGYAEVLKYGLIRDPEFFEYLENNYSAIFDRANEALTKIITRSCEIKAEIVSKDEKEQGIRALLNLGHSFGHVLESQAGYDSKILNHGEAVGVGMLMAAKMSVNLGYLDKRELDKIRNHLAKTSLDLDLLAIKNDWNKEGFVKILQKDKKNSNGKLNFILLNAIGDAFFAKDIAVEEFHKVVDEFV